jgi:hypothetical protein
MKQPSHLYNNNNYFDQQGDETNFLRPIGSIIPVKEERRFGCLALCHEVLLCNAITATE